ncbi:MAG TPA: hypothetical protein VFQ61_36315 [Polyangiaceae bacterium]|nr:hypothetical protein [Polyangiaceae bacterium]
MRTVSHPIHRKRVVRIIGRERTPTAASRAAALICALARRSGSDQLLAIADALHFYWHVLICAARSDAAGIAENRRYVEREIARAFGGAL